MAAGSEREQLHALGHAVLAIVNASILVAILAVILAPGSQAAAAIRSFFALLAWLVGQVIRPVTGGTRLTLSNQLAPAGGYSEAPVAGAGTGNTATGTQPGTGTAPGGTGTTPGTGTGDQTLLRICDDATGQATGYVQKGFESLIPHGSHLC